MVSFIRSIFSALGRGGRGFSRLFRRGGRFSNFIQRNKGYSRLGQKIRNNRTLGSRLKTLGRNIKQKTRSAIKGTWRKLEVDPVGTAISAYNTTRTPSLRLDFPQYPEVRGNLETTPNIYSNSYSYF